jgi:hypothetical protein
MTTIIRTPPVNTLILDCLSAYLKDYSEVELLQSLADYSLPQPLIAAIEQRMNALATQHKSDLLNEYVKKQKEEDKQYAFDSTQTIVYDSKAELEKISAEKGARIDAINALIAKAQHNYRVMPSGKIYQTPSTLNERLSNTGLWYERKQYFDLNSQINAIKDKRIQLELRELYQKCFFGSDSKTLWNTRCAYQSTMPILLKKLYWAIALQKLQDELDDLLAWRIKPKVSSIELRFRTQRAQTQLPKKPSQDQKINFLLPSHKRDYDAQARAIEEDYAPLSLAESTQIFVHLINRIQKRLDLGDINTSQIRMFSKLQMELINTLKTRIDPTRNSLVDQTLAELAQRIANVAFDSDSSALDFYDLINTWRQEPASLKRNKTNGAIVSPSTFVFFSSRKESVLEYLLERIQLVASEMVQHIPQQGYMVLGAQG